MSKKGQAEMAKKRANLYSKYLPLVAQFCTELSGNKKEPNYKKMIKEEISIEEKTN
jgi:DNA topoisomerase-6 subunit B